MPVVPPPRASFVPVLPRGLPIFRSDSAAYAAFYAPGYLAVVPADQADRFAASLRSPASGTTSRVSARLGEKAEAAVHEQRRMQQASFVPECLTLYLHNQCNLRCRYCYAQASPNRSERLTLETIRAAAEFVAESCHQQGRPFTVVFHGGGEPVLEQDLAEQVSRVIDQVANRYDVPTFRYAATNGVMSRRKALWLARRFDLVGLSCDGPADIQNHQRPRWDGRPTAKEVELTAHVLNAEGRRIHVRATLTRAGVTRQSEIVEYLCEKIAPAEIHLEPVYSGGRANSEDGLGILEAADLVDHFLRARQKASSYGIPLIYPACRLDAIYGPYCNVFRNVLNLVPGDVATGCFKTVEARQARASRMVIGSLDESGRFATDAQRIGELRRLWPAEQATCRDCFNQYHCPRECPDRCNHHDHLVDAPAGPGIRCRFQMQLADAILQEKADALWTALVANPAGVRTEDGSALGTAIF